MFKLQNIIFIIIKTVSFLLSMLIFFTSAQAEVSVIDDRGKTVTLEKTANRIISLAPHITESLFAAGAGNKIIAAVSYSDYPEAAKKIPRVGGYPALDIEKIVALNPDLVVAWFSGNNMRQVNKLMALGLTVFLSEPRQPVDIAHTIQRFGILAGSTKIADNAAAEFLKHYSSLKETYSDKEKVKVFYQIWNRPLMTINGQHLISTMINLCGGENVFAKLKSLTPKISLEAVIASRAEVIVAGGMGKAQPAWSKEWQPWPQIPAVKNKHVYFIDPALLQRVGPRILQGADALCILLEKARF